MQVSSLTVPKDRQLRVPSDDTVLLLPSVLAVFDGATSPQRGKPGVSSGRLASHAAAEAVAALSVTQDLLSLSSGAIFAAINLRVREESLRQKMEGKPSTTMAMAIIGEQEIRLLVHGDSGIRVNGENLVVNPKIIDEVSTRNRLAVRPILAARQSNPDETERLTRTVLLGGYAYAVETGLISQKEAEQARKTVVAQMAERLAAAAIIEFLDLGISRQYLFANRGDHPLGFSTLNGDETRMADFIDERVPRAEVDSLEIFSDGYFLVPDRVGVAAWEAAFAAGEMEDFYKVHRFANVKGSTSDEFADDRSVVVAEFINGKSNDT